MAPAYHMKVVDAKTPVGRVKASVAPDLVHLALARALSHLGGLSFALI